MKLMISTITALTIAFSSSAFAQEAAGSQKAVGVLESIDKKLERIATASETKRPIVFTLKSNVAAPEYWQGFFEPVCTAAGFGKVLARQENAHGYMAVVCYD